MHMVFDPRILVSGLLSVYFLRHWCPPSPTQSMQEFLNLLQTTEHEELGASSPHFSLPNDATIAIFFYCGCSMLLKVFLPSGQLPQERQNILDRVVPLLSASASIYLEGFY